VLNSIALTSASNVYTATYTNTSGANSTQAFTITINPTTIVPYLQVNGGAWQQVASVAVNVGDTVNLGPQPQTGGSWSWTGPNGFASTSRVLNAIALTSASNVYTATYTNTSGANSTQAFTITINPTTIVPYLQVNGGAWQQTATVAVNVGDTVNLGPQPQSGGSWSWTGPNGFTSTSRVLNSIALTSASNVYMATYTNTDGVNSTQAFTITVNPTPIVPYLQGERRSVAAAQPVSP
jgi:predicted lipoprotein